MNDTIYSLTLAAAYNKQAKLGGAKQTSQISGASMMSTGPVVQQHNVPHSARAGGSAQPKFIRKKPQVIHSIEFSEGGVELKATVDMHGQSNLFVDDDQLRLAEPPLGYGTDKCQTTPKTVNHNILKSPVSSRSPKSQQRDDEQLLITKMIDELKLKKQQESLLIKSTSTIAHDRDIPNPMISSSPENLKEKSSATRSKSPQAREYEILKLKKIEELKKVVITEKLKANDTKSYISGASLMQQPYQTTVSRDNEDDGCQSESTVHYLNESSQNVKRQSLSATKPKKSAERKKSKSRSSRVLVGANDKSIDKKGDQMNTSSGNVGAKSPREFNPSKFEQTPNPQYQKQAANQAAMIDLTPAKPGFNVPKRQLQIGSPRTHFDQAENFQTQNQLITEKTQQIFFKKLQKEVEMAIRSADVSEKGSLTMEELKHCYFFMDYLPFIQMEMAQGTTYPRFGNPRNHISTNKGLVLQEKEFLYNFWCTINPLNAPEVNNALLYDILLLMIFNIQQPISNAIATLTEYLEKLYRELNIELDQLSNFNSSSSHSLLMPMMSNLSKYLAFSNLWPIEKLITEFRQVHANKVSNVFSTNRKISNPPGVAQQTKFTLSPSNMAQSPQQNILVNPTDGRKYKKLTVEEHLSNLTFSPVINDKTKKLDHKVTQRLLQESSRSRTRANLKRDVSADDVTSMKATSSFFKPANATNIAGFQTQAIEQENDIDALNQMKRYDLLVYRQQVTEEKIQKAKENKLQQMLSECTFKPNTNRNGGLVGSKSYQNLNKQTQQAFQDITQRIKSQKSKLMEQTAEQNPGTKRDRVIQSASQKFEKEVRECTFKPQINSHTPRQVQPEQVPKGYYEMINRIRKVTEEKKAMEEKIQKKVIGENYDKVKLMNLKPPSFLNEEERRQKKRLLMYIDVNINPTKTGRIGIYEGDDIRDLVKNFQKTFQLNKLMVHLLTQQLEEHLRKYYERLGIPYQGSSVFPSENLTNMHETPGVMQLNANTQSTYMHYMPMTLQENEFESQESRAVKFAKFEDAKLNDSSTRKQDESEDFPQHPEVSSFHHHAVKGMSSGQFLPYQSSQQMHQSDEDELSDAVSTRKEHNSLTIPDMMAHNSNDRKSNIENELYSQLVQAVSNGRSELAQFSLKHNSGETYY